MMQGVCRKRGRAKTRAADPNVPHTQQEAAWDCGIACVLMVLRSKWFLREADLEGLKGMVAEANQSIWTVDLLYLLRRNGVKASFFTVTLGVDPTYAGKGFYNASFDRDRARVSKLFSPRTQAKFGVRIRKVGAAIFASSFGAPGARARRPPLAAVRDNGRFLWGVARSLRVVAPCCGAHRNHLL